jgi:hypothetical protein
MDERTLTALKGSIAAWESRAEGNYLRADYKNCPLCHLFNSEALAVETDCVGCPVYMETEEKYCDGTPCEQYFDNEAAVAVAEREVEFLKSLLPEAQS